jgi:predicted MFS family arabinose efflux permease
MDKEYEVSSYRWVNITVYTLVIFTTGAGYVAVGPLLEVIAERYSVGFGAASMLLSVIAISQVLLSIPTGWVAGRIGFKLPVALGASLLAVGFLLRGTANSYGMFTFWTVIAGLGFGIIWAPIGVLAATWFPAREIGVANTLWAVGYGFGQAFGALTSLTFMQNYGWDTTWLTYGIIAAVIALAAWILLKPRPRIPPEPRPPIKPAGLQEGVRQTMNQANRALQYTVFAPVGVIVVATAIVPAMLIAKGVGPATVGVIVAAAPVGAAVGSLVVPPFAFGGGRARNTALASAIVAPICLVALFYAPVSGAGVALLMTINFVFGLTGVAVVTLSMGMGQMQPGVNPGNAGILSGVFLTSIGLGGAVFPAVAGTVVERSGPLVSAWLLAAMIALCAVVLALFVIEPAARERPSHDN